MLFASNGAVVSHPGAERLTIAAAVVLAAMLAACGSDVGSSPGGGTPTGPIASATAPVTATAAAIATAATPSANADGPARCAVTSDAAPSATIGVVWDDLGFPDFGDPVTVKVGQAVAFVNDNQATHTVTEGTYAEPAPNACVDVTLPVNTTVVVTFNEPGTYQFTCRPHKVMQTSVVVE